MLRSLVGSEMCIRDRCHTNLGTQDQQVSQCLCMILGSDPVLPTPNRTGRPRVGTPLPVTPLTLTLIQRCNSNPTCHRGMEERDPFCSNSSSQLGSLNSSFQVLSMATT
eukprot:TRINITY_DN1890_c0_g1_i13.p2 TRINITY_DN1890_c0_g1~~TRINITY_DN1890_c0_g1_i13.p2  ORF type:complete len:124 (+),score=42.77 TRINITY_DN1890_c0_g1_i13:46-372(+)